MKTSPPVRLRTTLALLAAIAAGAVALGHGVAVDLHVPAARLLAAECQGFEALASVGHAPLTCDAAGAPVSALVPDVVPPRVQGGA